MRKLVVITMLLALVPMVTWAGGNCCGNKCGTCCKQHTCTKACDTGCKSGCGSSCAPACNTGCAPACPMPCACMAWETYCGCAMLNSLCISLEAACNDGTAGPLKLVLHDNNYDDIATIELAGPIDGYYTTNYTFDTPIRADSVREAVLINDTDDPVTLTWLQVWGSFGDCCGGWTYIDHTCPGVVIGPGGCPRMVLF